MNKYMGFYELMEINLPTVPWKQFTADTRLENHLLWTVRVAVERSNDLNLPRAVGVCAEEAVRVGKELLETYDAKGMVIYYPYFIAQKSGVLDINRHRTVMEAVDKDLWNLVTFGKKNVTAIFTHERPAVENHGDAAIEFHGDATFLSEAEINELLRCSAIIRGRFREELAEGKAILAEWSFAFNTDIEHEPIGERYLVFYELRGI